MLKKIIRIFVLLIIFILENYSFRAELFLWQLHSKLFRFQFKNDKLKNSKIMNF